jgi:hypothetical protein
VAVTILDGMSTSAERMRVYRASKKKRAAERERENQRRASRQVKRARAAAEKERRRQAKEKAAMPKLPQSASAASRAAERLSKIATHAGKSKTGARRTGRPRDPGKPRCPCGEMTAARAKHQGHHCGPPVDQQ